MTYQGASATHMTSRNLRSATSRLQTAGLNAIVRPAARESTLP